MNIPTQTASKTIYVTRTGLPLSFKLEWPFRHATSGADFDVLHTVITLENTDGLRALVAVNLSATCAAQRGGSEADRVCEIWKVGAPPAIESSLQLQT
jgi:hypothetical protein